MDRSMFCVSVIGARPQFIKAAVVSNALKLAGAKESIVHSGQHYDDAMSGRFLRDLGLQVEVNLGVGSDVHAVQTARMMTSFDAFLDSLADQPDWVIVFGDTNSTLAASLVAAKRGIPIAHVEAGLRSYNRAMPEEVNRVLTDHLSEVLFCSSDQGRSNLRAEGIHECAYVVGDVMLDAFGTYSGRNAIVRGGCEVIPAPPFVLLTLHRPSNTEAPGVIERLQEVLRQLEVDVLWPVHPRLRSKLEGYEFSPNVHLVAPMGYFEILAALSSCNHVITDSGGLQKEAYWSKTLCTTLRQETEWTETLENGWNVLATLDDDLDRLLSRRPEAAWVPLYGDGSAGNQIVAHLQAATDARVG